MSGVLVGTDERTEEQVRVERGPGGPIRFWRGQGRYEVGELIDHRVEPDPWWRGAAAGAPVAQRHVWRIEAVRAGRSRSTFAGVFDLSWEPAGDRWLLVRVHD
ncbi:hypothetical protein SAMN05660199_02574 [Klenkia soli]|uniref:DUF6504 domain-containing protein n=1 Tax=Klenkia soli TaxID=1052260 RepID=A0A1H0MBA2_9ACTN|nr:DUF6504 family protein [Klenkia soli]SDO77496.1 hypothetical protein SAMN05660199_02574 [Klenkia soli]